MLSYVVRVVVSNFIILNTDKMFGLSKRVKALEKKFEDMEREKEITDINNKAKENGLRILPVFGKFFLTKENGGIIFESWDAISIKAFIKGYKKGCNKPIKTKSKKK